MYQTIKNVPDVPCPKPTGRYLDWKGKRPVANVPDVPCPKPTNQISIPGKRTHQIFYKCPNVPKQASGILRKTTPKISCPRCPKQIREKSPAFPRNRYII